MTRKNTKPAMATKLVSVRLHEDDVERIQRLAEEWPMMLRGVRMREAMRLGLDVLEHKGLEALRR